MTLTQITEKGIKDGEIVNADINASAAIAGSKISPDFGSQNIATTGSITGADLEIDSGTLSVDASNNRVGIGTTSPNQLLEVANSSGGATISISTDQQPGSVASKKYNNLDFTGYNNSVMARIQSWDESSSTGQGFLTFHTHLHNTGLQEHLRIMNDGKIGIGTTSPSDFLHCVTSDFTLAKFESTSAGDTGPTMILYHNSSSPADNDYIGGLYFHGNHSGNSVHNYSYIAAQSLDVTDGTEDSNIVFATSVAGATAERMRIHGSNVGIGTTSPAQLFHVNGQAKVGTLGVGQDAGSSTLGVNGNISISPSGNTSWQKFSIDGSQVTTGSALTINNYGDVEGDYYFIGVNATLNSSGSNIKTNDAKRHAGLYLDGRMGAVHLTSSQTSTSTINSHYTFDRNGNFSLAGNVVVATSGAGIDFGSTAAPNQGTGTSELLDDYEEGTWTPVYGASAVTSSTYINTVGRYTKVGRLVTFTGRIQMTASVVNTNNLTLGGFPYACSNTLAPGGFDITYSDNWYGGSSGDTAQVTFLLSGNTSYGYFYNGDGNHIGADDPYEGCKRTMHFKGQYETDS